MAVQVVGILVDPVGVPMQVEIRVTAMSSNVAVEGSQGKILTGSNGEYDFNLEEGVFLIQLLQAKEYSAGVTIQVEAGTPSPITLGTLLENYEVPVE